MITRVNLGCSTCSKFEGIQTEDSLLKNVEDIVNNGSFFVNLVD